jgi:2-keto-myo-inositol isomerase
VHCFHMNDYPADPPRAAISDAHRVWPGDGIAPIGEILGYMAANHCRVYLSLELFNKEYWQMEALAAAKLGLSKMRSCLAPFA